MLLVLAALPSLAIADGNSQAIVPSARVELFNGKDFSGWTFFVKDNADPTNAWSVANGVIHCAGKPNSYLRTEKDYRNYKLTVEWRFVKVAPNADNTGVLVHMQSPDQLWPPCVQCQGRYQKQGDLLFMNGAESKEHRGLDANAAVPKHGPANEKAPGEWNLCELICAGDSVKAYINGKLLNETTECTVSAGRVGFQCEGAEFEIRKVFLEPLTAASPSTQRSNP
jgi:hypothetical protein